MKMIEQSFCTVKKTLCPFCSFGCEFGIIFDDFGLKGIEYIHDGSSEGRLCPRGSAAVLYLDHPRRLSMPLKNGKVYDWQKITKELKKAFEHPKKVAVTFDRNITIEEYQSIVSFCEKAGVENIASTYFEPEAFLKQFLSKPFSIDSIGNANMIIVLGDPFNQSPMISQSLINWKLSNRNHRLVVIDSINSHTAVYASDFLRVKVGTEPLVFCALAREGLNGIDIPAVTGISASVIKDISQNFKNAAHGFIIAVLPFGHTYDALFLAESMARLSTFSGKQVVPFVEFSGFEGNQHFGSVVDLVKKKKIKHIINFGELFPYYYPQFHKNLKAVDMVSTSPLKFNTFTTLPGALNLEKSGTIFTTFGKKHIPGTITPASGVRTVDEILTLVSEVRGTGKSLKAPEMKIDTMERARKLIERSIQAKKKRSLTLIGEKIAYNFLGLFEKERMKMNPMDAHELGLLENDVVSVTSKDGEVDIVVKLTTDVAQGIVAVPPETPDIKGLFDFEIDSGVVNFIPTEVELCRKG
ncbi:hypothetical protein AMJ52_08955 [candidate division TA06 bacterium DG_78]|uniref:4Fe-4S Mo/W bis-MGD-type domain-containing protein n=1 Tax=candidate division TA06 bacterium DG_78 TaxID=1703772 RepID=A0A0S7Y9A2_UNCT6|nr:MAG: hypothetical protein AMJ52_08955 [candidate division TA06 bacterium DG_78]